MFARCVARLGLGACLGLLAAPPAATAQCNETSIPIWGGPRAGAQFGFAADLAPGVAVVGAPGWEVAPGVPLGLVTVARWNGGAWVPEPLPVPASVQPGERFGAAVAINEAATVIAVGAPLHGGAAAGGGLLAIYEWNAVSGAWEIAAEWPGIFVNGWYGFAVDASGDRIVVGEPGGLFAAGVVSVHRRTAPGTWVSEGFWIGVPGDGLGFAVSLSGGILALGAPFADPGAEADAGMVFTKAWDGAGWVTREDIPGWSAGDQSGWAVDVHGQHLAIGQPGFSSSSLPDSGQGMVGTWNGSKYFFSVGVWDATGNGGRIGSAVAVSARLCGVGAPAKQVVPTGAATGEIRRMQWVDDLAWQWEHAEPSEQRSSSPQGGAQFGFALAAEESRLLVSSPFQDVGGLADAGIVKVLEMEGQIGLFDEGHALAGFGGQEPRLDGSSGLCADPQLYLWMTDARPGAFVTWVVGLDPLFAPFRGGVMVPDADLVVPYGYTWPDGSITAGANLPVGFPAYPIWLQAWIADPDGPKGLAASNGLRIDVPAF